MMEQQRSAVVLGGTGFLGTALSAELRRIGLTVVVHSSRTCDVRVPEALECLVPAAGPDAALIVLAALPPRLGRTVGTMIENISMVCNIARFLERHPFGHVTFFGSDAVYPFSERAIAEDHLTASDDFYATAKLAGENILRNTLQAGRKPLLVARLTGVFGPGDPNNSYGPNRFARSLAEARMIKIFGDGEETRDHIYVEDAARIVAALIERRADGIFNIASGVSRSFADVIETYRRFVPYEIRVDRAARNPGAVITHRRFDITKLRSALPDLSLSDFETGLRATFEFFSRGKP